MEQSTKSSTTHQHLGTCSVTTLHVWCATLQHAAPRSPYQQGHRARLHGQESTMAITCLDSSSMQPTMAELQCAWMSVQNWFLGVLEEMLNLSCTSWRLHASEYTAHHTLMEQKYCVWCVQSNIVTYNKSSPLSGLTLPVAQL